MPAFRRSRIIIITMMISGALAGMMALNPIMGDQHRLAIDFVAGAGFVGIAVALMGRAHPVGIVLAAILFGMLYQGGAELAFDMPAITRDMIVVIQGLVILFAGALEHMFRPSLQCASSPAITPDAAGGRRSREGRLDGVSTPSFQVLDADDPRVGAAAPRLPCRALFRALRRLRHRARGQDAGRRLRRRRGASLGRSGLAPSPPGSDLLAAIVASIAFALVHGFASITHRGNQIVSGVAINFLAAGFDRHPRPGLVRRGRPHAAARQPRARFAPIVLPRRRRSSRTCRSSA